MGGREGAKEMVAFQEGILSGNKAVLQEELGAEDVENLESKILLMSGRM